MKKHRSRKPERAGSLLSLGEVLPVLYRDLNMEKKVNEFAALALWPSLITGVAGFDAAQQTRAVRLRSQNDRTTLVVQVNGAALAAELGFHAPALIQGINGYSPQTGVTVARIQWVIGNVNG